MPSAARTERHRLKLGCGGGSLSGLVGRTVERVASGAHLVCTLQLCCNGDYADGSFVHLSNTDACHAKNAGLVGLVMSPTYLAKVVVCVSVMKGGPAQGPR